MKDLLVEKLKPEAAYFAEEWGNRTMIFVLELPSVDMMPVISEPNECEGRISSSYGIVRSQERLAKIT